MKPTPKGNNCYLYNTGAHTARRTTRPQAVLSLQEKPLAENDKRRILIYDG